MVRTRARLVAENIVLRHQLSVFAALGTKETTAHQSRSPGLRLAVSAVPIPPRCGGAAPLRTADLSLLRRCYPGHGFCSFLALVLRKELDEHCRQSVRTGIRSNRQPYFSDTYNHSIRRTDARNGVITTLAGTDESGFAGDDGPATQARMNQPYGIVIDLGTTDQILEGLACEPSTPVRSEPGASQQNKSRDGLSFPGSARRPPSPRRATPRPGWPAAACGAVQAPGRRRRRGLGGAGPRG
jgi:hypothetical protein